MYLANGVEILQLPNSNVDFIDLPAVPTDVWAQGAFLYWDSVSSTIKAFQPADTTATASLQSKIIGISLQGKKLNDNKASVALKAQVLMDSTNVLLGAEAVVKYNATTGKYTAYEGSAYNVAFSPTISLTGNFLVWQTNVVEADNRAVLLVDGTARWQALN
jgi:hypothetical protein